MNIKKILLTALIGTASFSNMNAQKAEPQASSKTKSNKIQITGLIDNTIINKNMFFGINFGNNVMNQTYGELGIGTEKDKIVSSIWVNYDTKDRQRVEMDYTLGYTKNIPINENNSLSIQPTLAYYVFPNTGTNDCQEAYIKIDYSGPIDTKLKLGKAFGKDSGEGYMACLNLSTDLTITDKLSATLNIGSVYNSKYFTPESKGISHIEGTISGSYELSPHFSLNASKTGQKRVDKSFAGVVYNESYWKIGITGTF